MGRCRPKAVVEREQRVAPECDGGRFLLGREDGRVRPLRSHRGVLNSRSFAPLRDGLAVDTVAGGESGYGLLAALDGAPDGRRRAG